VFWKHVVGGSHVFPLANRITCRSRLNSPRCCENKKKPTLPDLILKAQTVYVVIHPDAAEPLTDPTANRTAEDAVEKAIMKWGRFSLAPASQTADLIIAVRKGHAAGPMIRNSPADDRPLVIQPTGEAGTRVGGQRGRPPDLNDPGLGGPTHRGPQISNQISSSEDSFEVYMGGVEYPLDAPPLWCYMARDALKSPRIDAVEQFRKAIDESEQQGKHKP
jgi:hypothetical protein